MLDDTAPGLKGTAAGVLGAAHLTPSDRSVRALATHLNDTSNGPEEFLAFAASLLRARPADVSIVHAVLAGTARYPKDHIDEMIIQTLGLNKIECSEALAFIRAGFADSAVRPAAIDAVGRMPASVRDTFTKELQSTLADPAANDQTKNAASYVLMQR